MRYEFGSHKLDIGIALEKIVDLLENDLEYSSGDVFSSSVSCYLPSDSDGPEEDLLWET